MKKVLFTLLAAVISFSLSAQGINFEENHELSAALAKAKSENKLVFIDAYAEWCGPCKIMARDIFPLPEVGEYYNENFVNLMLDMEKPENREISQKYEVRAFPTYLFLDSEGELVHKALGSMPADRFIEVAKQAADSENNLMALQRKLDRGDRSYATVKQFIDANPYDSNVGNLINEYFTTLPESEIMSTENWDMFNQHVNDFRSPAYQYVLDNRSAVAAFVGKEKLDNKILNTMSSLYYANSRAIDKDSELLTEAEVRAIDSELFEKAVANVDMSLAYSSYMRNKDDKAGWDEFVQTLDPYLALNNKPATLSRFSKIILDNYKQFDDLAAVKKAAGWAASAYNQEPNEINLNNYANLLFAGGNTKAANKLVKSALKTAKKEKNAEMTAKLSELLLSFKKK